MRGPGSISKKIQDERLIDEYILIARETSVFKDHEIVVLTETVQDAFRSRDDEYVLAEERVDGSLAGYAIFGKMEWTRFSWEIYWIIASRLFRGKGVGKRLLDRVEQYVLKRGKEAVLITETSSTDLYHAARLFYTRNGFKEGIRIPHYYEKGDGLVTFYKKIEREVNPKNRH